MTQDVQTKAGDATWNRPARIIAIVVLAVTPIVVLVLTRPFWAQLVIAAIVAALLRPVRAFLQNRLRFPPWLALGVTVVILLLLAFLVVLAVPILVFSLDGLADKLANSLFQVAEGLADTLSQMTAVNIGGTTVDLSPLADKIYDSLDRSFAELLQESPEEAIALLADRISRVLEIVFDTISLLSTALFTVFFTMYLIVDVSWITQGIDKWIPDAHLREWSTLLKRLGTVWKSYVVGQSLVMLGVGVMVTLLAWLLGLPHPLGLGLLAGLFEIVPTLGPVLAAIPSVIIALFYGSTRFVDMPNVLFAGIVALGYWVVTLIDDSLITPNVQGHVLELPPLVVLLGVLVGVHEFGIIGGILALPVMVSCKVIGRYLYAKIEKRDPFVDDEEEN
jgi:predicted PurR-regulated permease PerM